MFYRCKYNFFFHKCSFGFVCHNIPIFGFINKEIFNLYTVSNKICYKFAKFFVKLCDCLFNGITIIHTTNKTITNNLIKFFCIIFLRKNYSRFEILIIVWTRVANPSRFQFNLFDNSFRTYRFFFGLLSYKSFRRVFVHRNKVFFRVFFTLKLNLRMEHCKIFIS